MTEAFSRRTVLRGIGHAAAFGTLASTLPRLARAADSEATYSLAMTYQYGKKNKFKADRFRDGHLPLLKKIYGDSVERVELRYAEPPQMKQGPKQVPVPPQFVIAEVNIWIRDIAAFGKLTGEQGSKIVADLKEVTAASPIVQYDKTLTGTGSARAEVKVGDGCQSYYFMDKEGARFDTKYYVDTLVPKIMDLYGAQALRRIEVCQGAAGQGGAKPLVLAAAHLYYADQNAFFTAGRAALPQLMKESPNYTDIFPVVSQTTVHAVG
jgi:hypothetical protein